MAKKKNKKLKKVPLGPEIDILFRRKTYFNDKNHNRTYRKRSWKKEISW